MSNYYGILEVTRYATNDEIKKSFRHLAKKYHPDKNTENKKWAEERTKLIIDAYRVLTDPNLRKRYDLQFEDSIDVDTRQSNNRRNGKKGANANSVASQIKTILNDLVNDNGTEAVEHFETLTKNAPGFALNKFLAGRDYLDCMFLLAEEYERLEKHKLALKYYKNIYENVKSCKDDNDYSFFFDETRNRIKKIYCKKLAKHSTIEESIGNYQNVLGLHINNNERAYIYKKISECLFELGEYHSAVANLNAALNIKPTLKGAAKIQTKLNKHFASAETNSQ